MVEKAADLDPPRFPGPQIRSSLKGIELRTSTPEPIGLAGHWRLPQNLPSRVAQEQASVLLTYPDDGSPVSAMGPTQVSGLCAGCAGAQEPRERRYCYTVTSLINTLLTLSLSFSGS